MASRQHVGVARFTLPYNGADVAHGMPTIYRLCSAFWEGHALNLGVKLGYVMLTSGKCRCPEVETCQ